MKKILEIPFFPNSDDDTHCFQAGLKMVLKYFWPDQDFSWNDLERISAKKPGKWTWATASILWLMDNGFEVADVEDFDYEKFSLEGGEYLKEFYGKEAGEKQINNSDMEQEMVLAAELIKRIKVQRRVPETRDIVDFIDDGYVVACNVNSCSLNSQPGYVGHFVVIKGYDDDESLYLNDPGLPPMENRKILIDTFNKAWGYPEEKSKNILAIRKRE